MGLGPTHDEYQLFWMSLWPTGTGCIQLTGKKIKKTPFNIVIDFKATVCQCCDSPAPHRFGENCFLLQFVLIVAAVIVVVAVVVVVFFSMDLTQCLPRTMGHSLSSLHTLTHTHTLKHTHIHAPALPTLHQRSFFSKLQSILPQAFPTDWPQ